MERSVKMRTYTLIVALAFFVATAAAGSEVENQEQGYVIQSDSDVQVQQPGPHDGGGTTTAYPFFSGVPDLKLVFRKRALHPGAAIGYHKQDRDEIYYVLSGTGELTMNGRTSIVGPGTSIPTRTGASHGLRQTGTEDLVIIIVIGKDSTQS